LSEAPSRQHPTAFDSPLSAAEVNLLDSTLLPALERHHLRLLAHALRTLQMVAVASGTQQLPTPAVIEQWLLQQPQLSHEGAFAQQLALQLSAAGRQLELVAEQHGVAPLQLELETLINWARQQADQRLTNAPPTPPQPAPEVPPANR
jgi:hypothetical protein